MKKDSSILSPLAKARGLGSAKDGTMHWWAQRVTSILLLPLSFYFLFNLGALLPEPSAHLNLILVIGSPVMALALILGIAIGFYHGALGVQVVIEDYVHHEGLKIAALLASKTFFILTGTASVFAVLHIALVQAARL